MTRILEVSVCLVFVATAAGAGVAPVNALFSEDEKAILDYLAKHPLPVSTTRQPSGPVRPQPREVREVERALELFRDGTPAMRLAVAGALTHAPEAVRFWRMCSDADYHARHFLVGLALRGKLGAAERGELHRWLMRRAHPGYASALLKNLKACFLYLGMDEQRQDEMIPLVRALYAQPGYVSYHKATIQELAVKLLPVTKRGLAVLCEWLRFDYKKVDPGSLFAMWCKWSVMQLQKGLLDQEFLVWAAARREFAEAWLICAREARGHGPPAVLMTPRKQYASTFRETCWAQVFSPDQRVRLAAIQYVLVRPLADAFKFVASLDPVPALRQQALADAANVCAELVKKYGQKYGPSVVKRYQSALRSFENAVARRPPGR